MRTDLKSLMEVAHYFKREHLVTMAVALRMAWAKAKGAKHAAVIARVRTDRTIKHDVLVGASYDEVNAARIAFGHAEHAKHMSGELKAHSSQTVSLAIFEPAPPMRSGYVTMADWFKAA